MTITDHHGNLLSRVGVVVIGRNEGDRLKRCLTSIPDDVAAVVYVDSGSTDDSVAFAESLGVQVVSLDMDRPFTAARARNEGAARLFEIAPATDCIQFIDGDCELHGEWLETGIAAMDQDERLAVVCGRRRERAPEASTYNRLIDMEWDTPVGEAEACGGDSLVRRSAFEDVGGFMVNLIAGEEPEMCHRMRRNGWLVRRLDCEMTLHDAAVTRFSQWWQRNVRSGHAYAESHDRHRRDGTGFCGAPVRSIVEWAVVVPTIGLGLAWLTWGASVLVFSGYGLLWRRIRAHRIAHGDAPAHADLYARYCILGKWPQCVGVARYYSDKMMQRQSVIIEYKQEAAVSIS